VRDGHSRHEVNWLDVGEWVHGGINGERTSLSLQQQLVGLDSSMGMRGDTLQSGTQSKCRQPVVVHTDGSGNGENDDDPPMLLARG
jgi:hypothetical protein